MSDENPGAAAQGPEVIDPDNVPVVFTDWVVTAGAYEGVLNITLGTIDHSRRSAEEDLAKVVVAARLRLSLAFAAKIHAILGDALGLSPDGPPHAQNPLKNKLN